MVNSVTGISEFLSVSCCAVRCVGEELPLETRCFEEAALFHLRALRNAYRNVLSPPWLVANANKTVPTYRVLRVTTAQGPAGQPSGGVGDWR